MSKIESINNKVNSLEQRRLQESAGASVARTQAQSLQNQGQAPAAESGAANKDEDRSLISTIGEAISQKLGTIKEAALNAFYPERSTEETRELGAESVSKMSPDVQDLAVEMVSSGACKQEDLRILQAPTLEKGQGNKINIRSDNDGNLTVEINGEEFQYTSEEAKSLIIVGGHNGDIIEAVPTLKTALNIVGGDGDDQIMGAAGNDRLRGGKGDDYINGSHGNDRIDGGDGRDVLYGGQGDDQIDGRDGQDFINGGAGNDILRGQRGDDTIFGLSGDDRLEGGSGDDVLIGGFGRDQVKGHTGRDRFVVGTSEAHGDEIMDANWRDITEYVEPQEAPDSIEVNNSMQMPTLGFAGLGIPVYMDMPQDEYNDPLRLFREQTHDDLEAMGSFAYGQDLMAGIDGTGNQVSISKYIEQNGVCVAKDYEKAKLNADGTPNVGIGSDIGYNPTFNLKTPGAPKSFQTTPMFVLAHELNHAYNSATGTLDKRICIETEVGGELVDGKPMSNDVSAAEFQATGLPVDGVAPNPDFATENAWRRYFNIQERPAYTSYEQSTILLQDD